MFTRVATLFTIFTMLAAASATPNTNTGGGGGPPSDQCNTGSVQCCESVADAGDPHVKAIAGLLGVDLGSVQGLVGLTCVPIVGGTSCSQQTVCCTGDNFNGVLVIGCSPININV